MRRVMFVRVGMNMCVSQFAHGTVNPINAEN